MQPMATIALNAAREAARQIVRAFDRPDLIKLDSKGHNDPVTNVDREAEAIIVEMLHKTYPSHSILGEENTSEFHNPDAEYEWVIDPIDGTTNFSRQIPHFCVSIACRRNKKLEHGVIVDPIRQEEFVASRGQGGQLNGRKMRVSTNLKLDGAVIATGGRYSQEDKPKQAKVLETLSLEHATNRQPGSACLELAYVAAGRMDAMWMANLNAWDMAAGALMVIEAGGLVGDFAGGADYMSSGNIVAATPGVFKQLTPVIRKNFM